MSSTSPPPEGSGSPARRGNPHPAVLATVSALLLWTTFPPANWGWLAWVALIPLFLLIPSRRAPASLYLGAWAGGMIFWALAIQWVRLSDPSAWLGWLTMAAVLSLFWPGFLALARLGHLGLRLPLMIAAPVTWVALEYVRAYFFTGFPWYYLAHSQHQALPVIQIADVTGSLGVSLWIAAVNAWGVDLLTLPLLRPTTRGPRLAPRQAVRLVAVGVLAGVSLLYGMVRMGGANFRDGPRVALLQTNLIQQLKDGKEPEELIPIYQNLIARALRAVPRPDLIVWPETSYPYGIISFAPGVDDAAIEAQLRAQSIKLTTAQRDHQRKAILDQLHEWTDQGKVPMLVGSLFFEHRPDGFSKYNAAVLFEPGTRRVQVFQKWHLVPFGEYVPLIQTFPWLTVFTPYTNGFVPSLRFGREANTLALGRYKLATAICFEDTVPQAVRRFFAGRPGGPPDVLLNLSNDGWFHGSEEHDMHMAISVFRAVEHRVPLARAANTGISAIVDGNGRVLASLPKLKEDVLSGVIPLDDRTAIYSAWGDWLGQSCLAVSIGLIPLFYYQRRRLRPEIA